MLKSFPVSELPQLDQLFEGLTIQHLQSAVDGGTLKSTKPEADAPVSAHVRHIAYLAISGEYEGISLRKQRPAGYIVVEGKHQLAAAIFNDQNEIRAEEVEL